MSRLAAKPGSRQSAAERVLQAIGFAQLLRLDLALALRLITQAEKNNTGADPGQAALALAHLCHISPAWPLLMTPLLLLLSWDAHVFILPMLLKQGN